MTELHKIFRVERDAETLILIPQANGFGFRYSDLQVESNVVRRLLDQTGVVNLVVDLGLLDYFGSEFIGAIIGLARHVSDVGGRAVLCNASERMLEVLETMKLAKLWPYFATREAALESLES